MHEVKRGEHAGGAHEGELALLLGGARGEHERDVGGDEGPHGQVPRHERAHQGLQAGLGHDVLIADEVGEEEHHDVRRVEEEHEQQRAVRQRVAAHDGVLDLAEAVQHAPLGGDEEGERDDQALRVLGGDELAAPGGGALRGELAEAHRAPEGVGGDEPRDDVLGALLGGPDVVEAENNRAEAGPRRGGLRQRTALLAEELFVGGGQAHHGAEEHRAVREEADAVGGQSLLALAHLVKHLDGSEFSGSGGT
mmetsp:Transcript_5566/g.23523  ORF Transcript_5566/g.23523 Transcript_5566/m.23523 type:complete len:251 (+) Transcript_5566:359-1111(+)